MKPPKRLQLPDQPWSLVFSELSEERGKSILKVLHRARLDRGVELLDPRWSMTMTFDRQTVELLLIAIRQEPREIKFEDNQAPQRITPAEALERIEAVVDDMEEFVSPPTY